MRLKLKSTYNGPNLNTKQKIKPTHKEYLTFNFSFLSKNSNNNLDKNSKKINKRVRLKLLERISSLSERNIVEVLALRKEEGLERIDEDQVNFPINKEFINSKRHLECDDGYWIFRLNNLGRVIGKKNRNIYYLLTIDTDFKAYKH